MLTRRRFLSGTTGLGYLSLLGCGSFVRTESDETTQMTARFLQLCDAACEELDKKFTPFLEVYRTSTDPRTHHMPFFEDAHAIWALCVAYDITYNKRYLYTFQHWADRVIALQDRMIPAGAYYMNYGREPGIDQGDWYVADSGTIGVGLLATSIRAPDATDKLRYLNSVNRFAELVTKNYIGANGGISNGLWGGYRDEWWCSTATAGALLFFLHIETALREHLDVALKAFDWMLLHDLRQAIYPSFDQDAPAVVFYCGEFYAMALHQSALQQDQRDAGSAHVATILEWLSKNQKGLGATSNVDYFVDSYMGGMPFLMNAFAREAGLVPPTLRSAGDEELRYVEGLLFKDGLPDATQLNTWGLMSWAMLSYAERLRPGALFRK